MELALMIEGQEDVTWPQWLALARACERSGIPAMFRSDHYVSVVAPASTRGSLDAWGTINALAAATSTVRLGTMVSPATFRHPSELAKLVTTADHISGGRIELGLGAGWNEREHAAYGFAFPPLRTRMDMLEEQIQVVLGSWSSGPFSFHGEHYALDELQARPLPVQRPHPPLLMGGAAGPRASALAARYADEYNTVSPTIEQVRERRGRLLDACERAGRSAPLPFSVMTAVIVDETRDGLAARAARVEQGSGRPAGSLLADPPDGWVIGTVDEAAERLRALADAGVSRVLCQHQLHDDTDAVSLLGERLAPLLG